MNLLTKYEERTNEEKNGVELYFESIPTPEEREELKKNGYRWHNLKKCWYKSSRTPEKQETKVFKSLTELTEEEKQDLAKKIWNSEDMQKYLLETYDFYKTQDGLIIELQKVKKITIDKTMYYDDEYEAPEVSEKNFINYNGSNIPGRNLENYLEEKEKLQTQGCATGRYDYQGIYFVVNYSNRDNVVSCNWMDEKNNTFKRYLTKEEETDFIELQQERKNQYIERLKKYFKKYGKNVRTSGYWANR